MTKRGVKQTPVPTAPDDMLRFCLEHALETHKDSPANVEMSRLLYPSPPSIAASPPEATLSPLSSFRKEAFAHLQAHYTDLALRERLDMPLGLADDRVTILNITPGVVDYSSALLRVITERLALVDFDNSLARTQMAASRFWTLDASGLSPSSLSPEAIERQYNEYSARAAEAHTYLGASTARKDKTYTEENPIGPPVLVLLGHLLPFDAVDEELLRQEELVRKCVPDTDDYHIIGTPPARDRFSKRGPMPLDEYWGAYAAYLKTRPSAAHVEPATPGQYREVLELRQRLRDQRLQHLQAYTGIRRARARADDALAGVQLLFFRFAENMLQAAGMGVASLFADPVFLDHPDMAGMRKSLLKTFDQIVIDELDTLVPRTSDRKKKDKSGNKAQASTGGINRGRSEAALCLLVKTGRDNKSAGDFSHRRHADATTVFSAPEKETPSAKMWQYESLTPGERDNYSFQPPKISREYLSWTPIADVCATPPINGLMEKRRGALMDIDAARLEGRMRAYFDPAVSWDELAAMDTGLTEPQSRFDPKATREAALATAGFESRNIRNYAVKPFDNRWCYHSAIKSLWSDPKARFAALCGPDNQFVVARVAKVIDHEGVPFYFTPFLGDSDLMRGHSYYFPLWFVDRRGNRAANLSSGMLEYLDALGIFLDKSRLEAARMVWNHVLAVGYSPAYLRENAEGIAREWPRIPFPSLRPSDDPLREKIMPALLESARLGESVAALLNLAADVEGVTRGEIRPGLREMAVLWNADAESSLPEDEPSDIPVTMEWGKLTTECAVLPSHGMLGTREYTIEEKAGLERGAWAVGVQSGPAYACLGDVTYDIHLNEKTMIRNTPSQVWSYTIGGYQVLKKWLSYRETAILGRPLTRAEVGEFCQIVRRIAALALLTPRLNRNYAVMRDLSQPHGRA